MKNNFYFLLTTLGFLCLGGSTLAQTPGTLTFTYTQPQPTTPSLNQGVKNVLAVWIEDASGNFIKTRYRFVGSSTKDHLPTWAVKAGGTAGNATSANCNVTDATTGATRGASTSPTAYGTKTVTWDGQNVSGSVNGVVVPDGVYKVWVESSWHDAGSNNHNEIISFSFTKGPAPDHQTPAGDNYINTVVLDWNPNTVAGIEETEADLAIATIYPNPSAGIFTVESNENVKMIEVFNTLGMLVFKKEVASNGQTEQIDLSNFNEGIYMFSVSNQNGRVTNYHVVLSK
ncbi:MAG: T9SS type A sorting domain-containing protein [Crocinitomicaceae bacterium]